MSNTEFTKEDYELIARDYAELKEAARKRCSNDYELGIVHKAYEFANEAHKNVRRRSGEPYMLHPIAVAKIVVNNIGLGYKSIAAALLHDVVEDTDYSTEDIRNLFGDKIASLVHGLTKIKIVLDNQNNQNQREYNNKSLQAENLKKILLTMNDDVRVILIKLADRLHNCRTIEFMPEYKRDKILSETMFIFIPLAHRLGLYEVKSEMENIWLRYKEPQAYNEISAKIVRDTRDREMEINRFIAPIEAALSNCSFKFQIKKRVKTPYSIWNKMKSKNLQFEQIYDLYAVRIIFDPEQDNNFGTRESERDKCYHIFSIITSIYKYKPDRMRDWVKQPKSNGYEALHCTLMSNAGIWIEVQIRSKRMDDIAEKGIAAHWAYKKDNYVKEESNQMDNWLMKVKEILISSDVGTLELLDIIHKDLLSTDIMVFTPKGEQKSITKGATALDFAYVIHTHIGNKAVAAKINRKLMPLSTVLKMGDQVEIITAQSEKPHREWLEFLNTRTAKNKVIEYFRNSSKELIEQGKEIVNNILAEYQQKFNDAIAKKLLSRLNQCNIDEIFFRIGLGIISKQDIREILEDKYAHLSKGDKNIRYVIGSEADPHQYIIGECCKPIPGDAVVGILLSNNSISVHKKSCEYAENVAATNADCIIIPQWDTNADEAFQARISLKGIDRKGLVNDVSSLLSLKLKVNIKALNLGAEAGVFEGYIDLYVHNKPALENIISAIEKIDGIQSVLRIEL